MYYYYKLAVSAGLRVFRAILNAYIAREQLLP